LSALTAISPVDGRYRRATEPLAAYFSEGALIKFRVMVEVEYFIALCELPLPPLRSFPHNKFETLRQLYGDFSLEDARQTKQIERKTNHDVKAVEYFLKARFEDMGIGQLKEFIHFGLTSQDINNTALPLALKQGWTTVVQPLLDETLQTLQIKADEWQSIAMLARTHGQPASPTTMGKEIMVFIDRLQRQIGLLETIPYTAKFGGATGNFNAHYAAYPDIDWMTFADRLIHTTLGLERIQVTTQIEPYDHLAAFCDNVKRINTILIDLTRDIWTYISMNYFLQKIQAGEVGSSTMPHKVNPIDFENAEGNLGVANAVFAHLAAKLPISRLQRDLTDSTVTRNLGVPLGHTVIALKSLLRGLHKLILNQDALRQDLENNWAVIAEAIQTILRREGYPDPFEALKALTRSNKPMDRRTFNEFIQGLDISDAVKGELLRITPSNYTGKIRR
jgi:adenylosuccinate lyase